MVYWLLGWQLGDFLALVLLTGIGLVSVLALIGLYARRIWALPQHTHRS